MLLEPIFSNDVQEQYQAKDCNSYVYFVSSKKSPKGTSKKTKSYLYNEMDTRF